MTKGFRLDIKIGRTISAEWTQLGQASSCLNYGWGNDPSCLFASSWPSRRWVFGATRAVACSLSASDYSPDSVPWIISRPGRLQSWHRLRVERICKVVRLVPVARGRLFQMLKASLQDLFQTPSPFWRGDSCCVSHRHLVAGPWRRSRWARLQASSSSTTSESNS